MIEKFGDDLGMEPVVQEVRISPKAKALLPQAEAKRIAKSAIPHLQLVGAFLALSDQPQQVLCSVHAYQAGGDWLAVVSVFQPGEGVTQGNYHESAIGNGALRAEFEQAKERTRRDSVVIDPEA